MAQETQAYLELGSENRQIDTGFQSVLDYIREHAGSERQKGDLFERLMLKYFSEDPDYKEQFFEVYLWKQWAQLQTEFDGTDIQRTVHLRKPNLLPVKCTALFNTIRHKQKISKHLLKKTLNGSIIEQTLETVDFLSIQIHKTASNSRRR